VADEVRLYRLGPPRPDLAVDVARRGKIRTDLIADRWDDLLRAAGTIKRGWNNTPRRRIAFANRNQLRPRNGRLEHEIYRRRS
jgi:hypothetical protein